MSTPSISPGSAPATSLAKLQEPLDVIREATVLMGGVQQKLDSQDREMADTLDVVSQRLQAAEDELETQLVEVESAASARQQERLLTRRLMATLPVPLLTTNEHGAIVEANAAAAELLGVGIGFLTRKPIFTFIDPATRRTARGFLLETVRSQTMAETSIVVVPRGGGSPAQCRVTLLPVLSTTPGTEEVSWVIDPRNASASHPADRPDTSAYHSTLLELCQLGVGEADLRTVLRRVAELATQGIADVDAVSVTLGAPTDPDVLASSSALAQAADGLQYLAGAGPIFDAYRDGRPVATTDAFDDPRWPQLARVEAHDRTFQAWLAFPLEVAGRTTGTMTLYGHAATSTGLGPVIELARPYVAATETLVRDSRLLGEMSKVRDELQGALRSRAVIDQAKGMIMITRGCDADEAFSVLVQMSNTSNRKVRELAASFVEEASLKGPALS